MKAPRVMEWLAHEALRRRVEENRTLQPRHNPKPAGHVCEGGASEDVLLWLRSRSSGAAWWSMHQIIRGTGRTAKACCWAVIYLYRIGEIDRERDFGNSRYLRYRARRSS